MELISIIIGIAGFLFGAYAYYKNRLTKELTIIYSSELIEGKQKPGVEMLYLGEPISDFIRYQITLFNSGKEDLKAADFENELVIAFDSLQVVSHHLTYSGSASEPAFELDDHAVTVGIEPIKPNNHITFEVLTGGHSKQLNPPEVSAKLVKGKPIKLHQQAFTKTESNQKYKALVKDLGLITGAFLAGLLLLGISFYSKYNESLVGREIDLREQLNILLTVESLLWFCMFIVSLVLLFFSYESLKVLSSRFQNYKFEELVQNKK
ncbi:hypothetical protein [Leucothrix pacifica]|uniref:Uncharacterized protein n=1 Tax=Leucothrix pacifica TaxID=1247513 RepID=A0A317CK54_9GAMM|nr:hypothetical protein [Leucothrix pacifica]PWQ97823.1 hypothetical protein DKW60_09530 [Leucothrix pacifica]